MKSMTPEEILANPAAHLAQAEITRANYPSSYRNAVKNAGREIAALQAAVRLLDETPTGTPLTFEGDCPSGSTYSPAPKWDGTPVARTAILEKVLKCAGPHAWRATLCTQKSVAQGMFCAEMRTGDC